MGEGRAAAVPHRSEYVRGCGLAAHDISEYTMLNAAGCLHILPEHAILQSRIKGGGYNE